MSAHMSSSTGIVRSPRMIPPMPSVSAIVWRRPNCFGTSKSMTVARLVAADLDHVDRVVGAVERGAPIGGRGDLRLGASSASATRRATSSDVVEPFGVDVEQRDLGVRELLVAEDVAEQVAREHRAARADERDLGHARRLPAGGRLTLWGGCGSAARGTGSRTPRTRARRALRRPRRTRRAPRQSRGLRPSSARACRGPRR